MGRLNYYIISKLKGSYSKMSEMKEKCPMCKTECEEGATVCSVCEFSDELGLNKCGK